MISASTLEQQGFDLIEDKAAGATRLHYIVNVNVIAWIYLSASNSDKVGCRMQRHLSDKAEQYKRNILTALHRIGVLDSASLPLFQALLSGVQITYPICRREAHGRQAMFMLLSGKLEKCWQLSAAASRVCLALGTTHIATSLMTGTTESEENKYAIAL